MPQQIINIIGDCAVKDKDLKSACEILGLLHDSFPHNIETTCQFSNILIKSGQLGKAKFLLDQANLLIHNKPIDLTKLAFTEYQLENYHRAN